MQQKLAPEITRQRLLIEGYYANNIDRDGVVAFLLGIATHLELRAYGEPVVFSPATGMGKDENSGYDAFLPLIDSGISLYVWTKLKFMSVVLYTCKYFDEQKAIEFTKQYFGLSGQIAFHSF